MGGSGLTIWLHSGGGAVVAGATEDVGAAVVGAEVDGVGKDVTVGAVVGGTVAGGDDSGGGDEASVGTGPESPVVSPFFRIAEPAPASITTTAIDRTARTHVVRL